MVSYNICLSLTSLSMIIFMSIHVAANMIVSSFFMAQQYSTEWTSPVKNTGVGSHSFLHEIFPTQGLISGLLHCRQILKSLSHQRSPIYTISALSIHLLVDTKFASMS